jgi:hypothetical protein
MKFELEFFDEFVKKECRRNSKTSSSAIPDFTKKKILILQEVERIKRSFITQLFQVEHECRLELFIQHHQAHIIRLADKVATAIDKEESLNLKSIGSGHTRINLCKILLQCFEDLLNYIEVHFVKYFNQDQKIPDSYALLSEKEFDEKLQRLRDTFKQRHVDERLTDIVLYPIQQFVSIHQKRNVTFRGLIYLKYLANGLLRLSEEEGANPTEVIYEYMFYLNFNSYHLLKYATAKIRNEIEGLPSMAAQLEHLSLKIKKLNQAHVKPSFAFKIKRESLKSLLSNWLEEEIHFIEKKRQLTLMIPPGGEKAADLNQFKVKTTLSVPQLAYTVRLLREAGVFTNENKADLIRFFSKNFATANSENISAESFRSKFFGFERSAVSHIQGILTKLIQHSKKDE